MKNFDCLCPKTVHIDGDQTGQGSTQIYVLYVIAAHVKQLAESLEVVKPVRIAIEPFIIFQHSDQTRLSPRMLLYRMQRGPNGMCAVTDTNVGIKTGEDVTEC